VITVKRRISVVILVVLVFSSFYFWPFGNFVEAINLTNVDSNIETNASEINNSNNSNGANNSNDTDAANNVENTTDDANSTGDTTNTDENSANGSNTTNSTNTVRQLTLQEQQEQVKKNLEQANEQLSYVEEELSNKLVEIQQLQDTISQYQSEMSRLEESYKQIQQEVSNTEANLEKEQVKLNKQKKAVKARLRAIYEQGDITYLDVLLNSQNVIDFLANFLLLEEITEYDNNKLDEIKNKMAEIEAEKQVLTIKKAQLKELKSEYEQKNTYLINSKTILENEKNSLTDSELTLMASIDTYKKQQEEIETLIQRSIASSTYELFYTGGVMIWPTYTSSYITSQFGSRLHPIQGIVKNHAGIDIGGKMNDPVYAAADGVIIYYGWMSGYGNTVMIDHGLNDEGVKIVTLYGHGNALLDTLRVGSVVKQGEQVMYLGSTGNSTGPHVHFEVRENGVAVDPKNYLSAQ